LALIANPLSTSIYAIDYPHNTINDIGCDTCHYIYGSESSLLVEGLNYGQDIDDTQYNALCWQCHNDIKAPYVKTHSSLQINNKYGDWTIECRVCHNPHYQKQARTYKSESYIFSDISTDIQINMPEAGQSLLTMTDAQWTDNEHQGLIVMPNINQNYYYKILSNTSNTLTIGGVVDLSKVTPAVDTFAITYGKLVKNSIALDNITITPQKSGTGTVKLFQPSGTNSFADGNTTYEGICEICHTETAFHRNNDSGNHAHMVTGDKKCTFCHKHTEGFKGSGCNVCHGFPPTVDTATGGPDGLANEPGVTGSVTAGAHDVHVNVKNFNCIVCHRNSAGEGATHMNGNISLGFSLFDGTYPGGIYDGQTTADYDKSEINTTVINTGTMTCDNIYCHGRRLDGTVWGGGKNTVPTWDGSVTCTSCHDTGGSSSDLSYKHKNHTNESRHGIQCEKCHYQTAEGSSSIKNQSYHVNNVKDIIFEAGGTLNTETKACTNTYCHSDARGGAPNVAVKWTDTISMQCDSCHNGRTEQEALEMSSNGHKRLIGSDGIRKFPCYYCHDATVDTSSNIKDFTRHANGTKDIVINSKWQIAGNPLPSYNPDTMVCDNIYCHSDGTTVAPEVRAFPWNAGHTECNSCHGHEDGTCYKCHDDGRTSWPAGQEWKSAMPMYENTGPGTSRANAHARHLLIDINCASCHANTVTNGLCTDCHIDSIPSGSMGEPFHVNPAYHVNKIKDIAFKDGGTFDLVNKYCSNTACHTGSDPQWGDSVNNLVICLECHGTTENDVDDYVYKNDTRAKINMTEWSETGHGRPEAAGNYISGNPPANFPGNPCWYCHDNSVYHGEKTNPFRLRQHDQFNARFDKECVYCHMEGLDSECLNCHNTSNSPAIQLIDITTPAYSQDHSTYIDGQTSCMTTCHDTDETIHKTGAGLWTAAEKTDIQNQYVMMGVCLVCHDDDSNGKCNQCHTGDQYQLGFDPGTGYIKATTAMATSSHFGYKHYDKYKSDGTWKGGKFCWDCHDPHGDTNIYMIHDKVTIESEGSYGVPVAQREVSFTRKQSGLDYARSSAPFNGICNVCHSEEKQHYRFDYGDGHNSGRVCTSCHEHSFSDSHASGKACNICHANKPIPRHMAFGLPKDCTKCHNGVVGGRIDIVGQLKSDSHHIQGVEVTNKHCYACHWESSELGLINTDYHSGYNFTTHESIKNDPVNLVIWGPGERPTTYEEGVTGISYDKSKIGTADERTELTKISSVCMGCHSDQNNDTQPFNIVDPDNGDCKTPRQYSWDKTSIAARYTQTGTTTWGKYTGTANAAKKDITKSFSAHGNAVANQGGWSASSGYDAITPDTRNGTQNVQCYDCHNSHGSKASGITSSYKTFNGTYNGANLKETQAGKGGYMMTYKPAKNSDPESVNPYNEGAGLCFDCHETATSGTKPWGYNSTFGATMAISGDKDTSRFGPGVNGAAARYPFRQNRTVLGGHLNASSDLKGLDGTPGTGDEAMGTINGLCTPCHDPHGISPSLGDDQQYGVPLLKGTWMTSPYKDDSPLAQVGGRYNQNPELHWWTDRRTFGGSRISEDASKFAGLCLRCHPKENLTDGTQKNTAFKTLDRIHESVKDWGSNAEHSWPCSKCHQPHSSGLPRLLQTNCLDYNHLGGVASGGMYKSDPKGRYPRSTNASWTCHESSSAAGGSWSEQKWNNVTPW